MTHATRPAPAALGRLRARFAMEEGLLGRLFDPAQLRRLETHLQFSSYDPLDLDAPDAAAELARVEVLVTGWGAPFLGASELDRLPGLRAILHGAGTVKTFLSEEVWRRGVLVTSAAAANAHPVAEYTLATILFWGKSVLEIASSYAAEPHLDLGGEAYAAIGNYRRTVGIVGASQIGRRVIELLRPFDFTVLVSDPYLEPSDPVLRSARSVDLDELFGASDIVSVHAPMLPETAGLISAELLETMRHGSMIINTARPGLIDQDALVRLAEERRIRAVLDVTDPEPLPLDHPLRHLPNVFVTPHLAGAQGNELRRLGESVVEEVEALAAGHAPLRPVRPELLSITA